MLSDLYYIFISNIKQCSGFSSYHINLSPFTNIKQKDSKTLGIPVFYFSLTLPLRN